MLPTKKTRINVLINFQMRFIFRASCSAFCDYFYESTKIKKLCQNIALAEFKKYKIYADYLFVSTHFEHIHFAFVQEAIFATW